jgi:glutathione S-transferase
MKLINARPSPFGRKVAIALLEKAIAFETLWDEPWGPDTCVAAYNPLAQLPILITDDGETLFESTYILEWIERRFPEPPLLPADDNGILRAKQLMVVAEGVLTAWISASAELRRPSPGGAWLERQRHKVTTGTDWLAEQIGDREFAVRDTFSQADIAIGANLALLAFGRGWNGPNIEEISWHDRLPALGRYVDRLEARPSFQATRPQMMKSGMQDALR